MQTGTFPVCELDLFDEKLKHFWVSDLNGLTQLFPFLKSPHKNTFFTLLIIDTAQGEIIIDNEKIDITNAKIFIIKPRCINNIHINNSAIGKIILFSEDFFSLRYNNNILSQFSFLERDATPEFRLSVYEHNRIQLILQLLHEEYLQKKSETQKVLRSYLNIFLFELERIFCPIEIEKNRNQKKDKIKQFEKLVEQNFVTKKRPSCYADLLNISTNYLNKLCKEQTGRTAGDIIRKYTFIEAQRLLYYTNYSVNEIADKLGFGTTSYFISFFKKEMGITPEQFRKSKNE